MPSRDRSRSAAASTANRSVVGRRYAGDPGTPQVDERKHVGEDDWVECPQCGRWVHLLPSGNLRGHRTVGPAKVACIYHGPPKPPKTQPQLKAPTHYPLCPMNTNVNWLCQCDLIDAAQAEERARLRLEVRALRSSLKAMDLGDRPSLSPAERRLARARFYAIRASYENLLALLSEESE